MELSVIDACEQRLADDAATVPDAAPNVRNGRKADTAFPLNLSRFVETRCG